MIKSEKLFNAQRTVLVVIATSLLFVLLGVFASSSAFASDTGDDLDLVLGEDARGPIKSHVPPGDSGTIDPNTGGSDRVRDYAERCGTINPYASSDGMHYQDCRQQRHEYIALPNDDAIRFWLGGNGIMHYTAWAVSECAPGLTREDNNRTLVGVGVSVETYWSNYYYRWEGNNVYYTFAGSTKTNSSNMPYNILNIDCVYQEWEDISYNQICIVAIDIHFDKVAGTHNLGKVNSTRATTPWGNGNNSLSACRSSNSLNASLGETVNELGRYSGWTRAHFQEITVRTYKNAPDGHTKPPDEIISIRPVKTRPGPNIFAQITCDPAHTGVSSNSSAVWTGGPWTWRHSDCTPDDPNAPGQEAYQCVNTDAATVNGRDGVTKATIFRSGEDNRITWNNPTIASSRLVSVTPKDTKVSRRGTPWNTPRNMPAGKNNVTLHTTSGTNVLAQGNSWMNGLRDDFILTANWASSANDPTVISPTWRYDAVLNTRSIRVDSISASFNGGTWNISPNYSSVTVPVSSTATCVGSIEIDAVRAINDTTG